MKKTNNFRKKALAVAGVAGLVVGTLGMGAFALHNNNTMQDEINSVTSQLNQSQLELQNKESLISELNDEVAELKTIEPVIINNTIEKIVEVDNGDMDFVLERLEDKMIIDDASDIVAELKAEDEALSNVLNHVLSNQKTLFEKLEDEGLVSSKKYVKILKTYSSYEDVEIITSDYKDLTYEFKYQLRVYDDVEEVKKNVFVTAGIDYDGEFYILNVE
jgi:hypothetical protein